MEDPDEIRVVGAAVVRGGRCLAARRASHVAGPGLWELPGGKVEPGETPRRALARELAEELDVTVAVGAFLGQGRADLGSRRIVLDVYVTELVEGEPQLVDHDALLWIDAPRIHELRWAEADRDVLPALERLLRARAEAPGS